MNPYKKAVKDLSMVKIVEEAILSLEEREASDEDYIHLNIQMISETINTLLKLKGSLEKIAIPTDEH